MGFFQQGEGLLASGIVRFPSTALLDVVVTKSSHFIHLPADIQHEVGEAATRVQTDAQVHVPVFR